MFFDKISEIPQIATRTSCAIFAVPASTNLKLKNPLYLKPDDSKKTEIITVEQMRDFLEFTNNRETADRYFIISPADAMNEAAQNALLKSFEEPHPYCHFILLTEQPSALLPTIRSRAQLFIPKLTDQLDLPPSAKPKITELAKKMIASMPKDLPDLAIEIAKNKTQPRQHALEITATAIEILYKSYFKTGNEKFLTKLPNFLKLYDNLEQNGHIKLHIVADLC